jgi:hypothetical protein
MTWDWAARELWQVRFQGHLEMLNISYGLSAEQVNYLKNL